MSRRSQRPREQRTDDDIFEDAPPRVERVEVVSEVVPAPTSVAVADGDILTQARTAWGLDSTDILTWRETETGLVLVTAGGRKLWWPEDADVTLSDMDKGRGEPKPTGHPGGVGRFAEQS